MRLRRGLQFSLSTLLLALTALAVGLGVRIHQVTRQRQAIQTIHRLGGAVIYDLEPSQSAAPLRSSWPGRFFAPLYREPVGYVSFTSSRQLGLHPELIAVGLAELKYVRELHKLRLEGLEVSDADLEQLMALKSLRTLDLSWTNVTEAGFAKLEQALPGCRIVK